jgi:hypothetical protein
MCALGYPAYPTRNLIHSGHIQVGFSFGQQTMIWGSAALLQNNHQSLRQQAHSGAECRASTAMKSSILPSSVGLPRTSSSRDGKSSALSSDSNLSSLAERNFTSSISSLRESSSSWSPSLQLSSDADEQEREGTDF